MRHRSDLVQMTNPHIQHMHKTLTQRNVQIHHGINDITGLTGLAIVDAIGDGQRDPLELAKLRDPRIQASEETMVRSLKGNGRPEHLFTLKQSRQMYQHPVFAIMGFEDPESSRPIPVCADRRFRIDESTPTAGH
jgi:hypothetical protein